MGHQAERVTYVLIDGENVDATLGTSILSRRPQPEERPRWDRLLQFAEEQWAQPARGLFFLAANNDLPMPFIQALLALGYQPIPLSGGLSRRSSTSRSSAPSSRSRSVPATSCSSATTGTSSHSWRACSTDARVGLVAFEEFRNAGF